MKKKLYLIAALVMVLVTGVISLPKTAVLAETAEHLNPEENITWDLADGKSVTAKNIYAGLGVRNMKIKLTGYTDTETEDGLRQITFTLIFNDKKPYGDLITSEQFDKLSKEFFFWSITNSHFYSVIDLKTGECLEGENDKGVKVEKTKNWEHESYLVPIEGYDHTKLNSSSRVTVSVRITLPKDYKDMAIIAGGYSLVDNDYTYSPFSASKEFFNDGISVYDSHLTDFKGYCHGLKVG